MRKPTCLRERNGVGRLLTGRLTVEDAMVCMCRDKQAAAAAGSHSALSSKSAQLSKLGRRLEDMVRQQPRLEQAHALGIGTAHDG